jgi:hypothetical protein
VADRIPTLTKVLIPVKQALDLYDAGLRLQHVYPHLSSGDFRGTALGQTDLHGENTTKINKLEV